MRIAIAADELTGIAGELAAELERRGHEALAHGALCGDAETARGARRWNDANVLALSLRTTASARLVEILDAWFEGAPSADQDRANVAHLREIEAGWH